MLTPSNANLTYDIGEAVANGGPGALNVGAGAAFPTWAGTVLDEAATVVLVLDSPADLWPVTWDLLRIGYDTPAGWLAGGMMAWRTAAMDIERLPQITVHELKRRLDAGTLDLLDVRQPLELIVESVPGAKDIPLPELRSRLNELPKDREILVICRSAQRAYYATRILLQNGFKARVLSGGTLSRTLFLAA